MKHHSSHRRTKRRRWGLSQVDDVAPVKTSWATPSRPERRRRISQQELKRQAAARAAAKTLRQGRASDA